MGFIREEVGNVTIEERRESFVVHAADIHAEFLYADMEDLHHALDIVAHDPQSRYAAWRTTEEGDQG